MTKDARFYFANLGADVIRCCSASTDSGRYQSSLERAYGTLRYLRSSGRPEVYEEGLLLLRGLALARESNTIAAFQNSVNILIAEYVPIM